MKNVKIITVSGFKGGTGKSTTAIHLARFLSFSGKTLVVDGDPNRTCISWAERGELGFDALPEKTAMSVVSDYQYVVIDMPARPDSADLKEIANGCNLVVIPSPPSAVSIEPTLETLRSIGKNEYRILLTIVPPRPNVSGITTHQSLKAEGIKTCETLIRRSVQFQAAALEGKTVDQLPTAQRECWKDYESFGKEILEVLNNG